MFEEPTTDSTLYDRTKKQAAEIEMLKEQNRQLRLYFDERIDYINKVLISIQKRESP